MSSSHDQDHPSRADSNERANKELLRHRNWLRTVLIARTRGDESLADDLLGELTVEALSTAERWSDLPETGPWLYRMAVRKFANHWRVAVRRSRHDRQYGEQQLYGGVQNGVEREPLEMLLDVERGQTVLAALRQLPGKDAEMLLLKYVYQWRYVEIETHLGIPLAKIGNRLRVARNRLAEVLLKNSAIADWAGHQD